MLSFCSSASTAALMHGVRGGLLALRLGASVLLPSAGSNATSHRAPTDFRITDPCNSVMLNILESTCKCRLPRSEASRLLQPWRRFYGGLAGQLLFFKYRSCYSASSRKVSQGFNLPVGLGKNARCFEGFRPAGLPREAARHAAFQAALAMACPRRQTGSLHPPARACSSDCRCLNVHRSLNVHSAAWPGWRRTCDALPDARSLRRGSCNSYESKLDGFHCLAGTVVCVPS